MAIRTHFDSQVGMEEVLAMGIEEGMRIVFSQIEGSSPARLHEGLTRWPGGKRSPCRVDGAGARRGATQLAA